MENVFFENMSKIPSDYSLKSMASTEKSVDHKGSEYTFIGCYEIEYSFLSQMALLSSALLKIILSVGLALLLFPSVAEDCQAGWLGKRTVKVYCASDALDSTESKVDEIGTKALSPLSKDISWYEKILDGETSGLPKQPTEQPQEASTRVSPSSSGKKVDQVDLTTPPFIEATETKKPRALTPVNFADLEKEFENLIKGSKEKIENLEKEIVRLEDLEKTKLLLTPEKQGLARNKVNLKIEKKNALILEKKIALLTQGIELFKKHGCAIELETYRLSDPNQFRLGYDQSKASYTATPSHFDEVFEAKHPLDLVSTSGYYDYLPTDPSVEDVWAIFGNLNLGGGAFTPHGFVQEEIMVHEMPDFAAYVAGHLHPHHWCKITTREGVKNANRVMQGFPTPYLLKGFHRVQAVNNKVAYGNKIERITKEMLLDTTKPLPAPQKVSVIAIAAPKLFSENHEEQWHPLTLEDNFNTLMAGFRLVAEQSKNPIFHSGRFGCGVFYNDEHAMYLLHCLAAQHTGMRVKLHGYADLNAKKYQESWNTVAPQLIGKSLKECVATISQHLHKQDKAPL